LDPRTGIVKEYTIPLTPGAMPGTHAVKVDKNDNRLVFRKLGTQFKQA